MMNISEEDKSSLLKSIRKACDTYKNYANQRKIELELLGVDSGNKSNQQWFDNLVRENGVTIPKRPYTKHTELEQAVPEQAVPEPEQVVLEQEQEVPGQEQEEPELVGVSIEPLSESGPLPDVPAEAPEATAEQLLVLDRALVQAAYRMQSETYQFQLDETEKRITQLKEEVEKLWTEVDQYRERIEECDRLIAEIEQAETVALR